MKEKQMPEFSDVIKFRIMKKSHTGAKKDFSSTMELEKSKVYSIVEILKYSPGIAVSKTILKRTTGSITVSSFDAGKELAEKASSFDTYIQIIEGTADLIINDKKYKLKPGEGIIIPAHTKHSFNAIEKFKMISIIIKSGYEEFA